jgi:hypothetical protein
MTIPTKTITLASDQWQVILEAAESHCDEGPPGQGWKSPRLSSAIAALDVALSQSDPDILTVQQCHSIIKANIT